MKDLPSTDRIITQQACVEEARALLHECVAANMAATLIAGQPGGLALAGAQRARSKVFYHRAMRRLQEVFYAEDEAPGA